MLNEKKKFHSDPFESYFYCNFMLWDGLKKFNMKFCINNYNSKIELYIIYLF